MTYSYLDAINKINNIFADNDPESALNVLLFRLEHPETSDFEVIDDLRYEWKQIKNSATPTADHEKEIDLLLSVLSIFNLNTIDDGLIPEQSFESSRFLTYCIEGTSCKESIMVEPLVHYAFKDCFQENMIVILRLNQEVKDYESYKPIFMRFANLFKKKYGLTVLNLDHPLAFHYISYDKELYKNDMAEIIDVNTLFKKLSDLNDLM
jgi:hypothetical protein